MICKLLGHKLIVILFPQREPDSIISVCLRCGKYSIIKREDTGYIIEEFDEEEDEMPVPPDNHFDVDVV